MTKVVIINGSSEYSDLFKELGYDVVSELSSAELVVFTGGEDVSPNLYGDESHPYTYNNPVRDEKEKKVFEFCIGQNIPMVGICRGAQFLNVMSGGRMYQHVQKHTASHSIVDLYTGETVYVSSTHHQMMLPGEKAIIIATANLKGEREWFDGQVMRNDVSDRDIEVVHYPDTQCLCFQPHPEFNDAAYEGMRSYFGKLVNELLHPVMMEM